ncbi:MAG: hypothetical protein KDE14_08625 [Rhodobacteraceae bacterium]|nr:hypothetical protein [Paracoccaceae bacterium]
MPNSAIVSFYRGTGRDHAGRSLADIWQWDHRRLEMVHDYIQWLFPLREPSRFNPDAPLVTAADQAAFRADPELQANLARALDLMLDFFGLVRLQDRIERGPQFASRSANWLEPANHNHLRLTRIMIALELLGRPGDARSLLACLLDIAQHEGCGVISERTLGFWRDAVPR